MKALQINYTGKNGKLNAPEAVLVLSRLDYSLANGGSVSMGGEIYGELSDVGSENPNILDGFNCYLYKGKDDYDTYFDLDVLKQVNVEPLGQAIKYLKEVEYTDAIEIDIPTE